MAYIIAGTIILIFIIIYFANKKQDREYFVKTLNDDEYKSYLTIISKQFGIPTQNGKSTFDVKKLLKQVKNGSKLCKNSKIEDIKQLKHCFDDILKCTNELNKNDFEMLAYLPHFDNKPRIEILCRNILESNKYILIEDKVNTAIKTFDQVSTITYPEIKSIKNMMIYILLEKVGFVVKRIRTIEKIKNLSSKMAKHINFYSKTKLFKEIKENNLFLFFSANNKNINLPIAYNVYNDTISNIKIILQTVIDDLHNLSIFDFSIYYRPLELLVSNQIFINSSSDIKDNFLIELNNQSTKLNIDEYVYTYILTKYLNRATPQSTIAKRINIFSKSLFFIKQDNNLIMLAKALTNSEMMSILFNKNAKKDKSITKYSILENTFAVNTTKNKLDFGFVFNNDNMSLSPNIPSSFDDINVDFSFNGVKHNISILQSNTKNVYVNGTRLQGIPYIKLGKSPMNILIELPYKDN